MKTELDYKREIIKFAHLCYERNLLVGMDGNLSVRLPSGNIMCTQAACHKGMLTEDNLVVIDIEGRKLRGRGEPTSEMAMHLACYQERKDVHAVIHAHPPIAVGFTIAGVSLARCVLPEVVLTLGVVPTLEYVTTGTSALAQQVGAASKDSDAMLMDRHGAVALGGDLLEAFCRLETLEHTARITMVAKSLGQVRELPPEEAVHLRSMGLKRYGGPPSAVARANDPNADLPPACVGCDGCNNPNSNGIGPESNLRLARIVANSPPPVPKELQSVVIDEVLKALGKS